MEQTGLVLGIVSAVAWSVSFYGQVWTNYRLQSVEGYSLEYQLLNQTGYLCYFFYSTAGYFFGNPFSGRVDINDILFSYHALFIVTVLSAQSLYYPSGKNRLSTLAILLNMGIWIVLMAAYLLFRAEIWPSSKYFSLVAFLGYAKLLISFLKYTPPAVMNCRRGSTKGWSIFNILLDIVGGVTSLAQVVIEIAQGQVDLNNGLNLTKLALALITIVYDTIFILQHYFFFKNHDQYYRLPDP